MCIRDRTTTSTPRGNPRPTRKAATRAATRRSARSAMPTLAVIPSDSARARAYGTSAPRARHAIARPAPRWSAVRSTKYNVSPPNTPASATRSRVESRNAPHELARPDRRAITPSSESEKTKTVMTRVPARRCPSGKSHSAATVTPKVPTIVTASGETPHPRSTSATGVKRRFRPARRPLNIRDSRSHSAPRPRGGDPPAGVPEQLGQRLGPRDDGQEVRVVGPARHHVLMQVAGDAGARDATDVHADVEPAWLRDRAHGTHRCLGEAHHLCLLYTSPSPRDRTRSRMPSS